MSSNGWVRVGHAKKAISSHPTPAAREKVVAAGETVVARDNDEVSAKAIPTPQKRHASSTSASVLQAACLYKPKAKNARISTKKRLTLEDVVQTRLGEERAKSNTFYVFRISSTRGSTRPLSADSLYNAEMHSASGSLHAGGLIKQEVVNGVAIKQEVGGVVVPPARQVARSLDVCKSCGACAITHNVKEGSFTCSRCGLVQSEGEVVGTYSDVERVARIGIADDMTNVNYSYGVALKNAVARHELTSHMSEAATEALARRCLCIINVLWRVVANKEVEGSIAFLITQGAQFAQENRQMPDTARCVDIILRKIMLGVDTPHMYSKFLLPEVERQASLNEDSERAFRATIGLGSGRVDGPGAGVSNSRAALAALASAGVVDL